MRRNILAAKLLIAGVQNIDGWQVSLKDGIIHYMTPEGEQGTVDVQNPLKDEALVEFHRRPDVPRGVHNAVESMASQWRRLVHTTGKWREMQEQAVR